MVSGHSILDYKACTEDFKIYNPYFLKIMSIIDKNKNLDIKEQISILLEVRDSLVTEYSFTIPYYDILKRISFFSPVVEIGAGSGYWARCLSKMGVDVVAYDILPPGENLPWEWQRCNSWFDDSWYNIIEGDERVASLHSDRALFLAWPMPMSPMAYNALHNYKKAGGKTVIYIGDPHPASSGDENFYEMLFAQKKIEEVDLYGWPGIREKLLIYSL